MYAGEGTAHLIKLRVKDFKASSLSLLGQSYKIINKEIMLRSLTRFPRKIDLKISLTGAP